MLIKTNAEKLHDLACKILVRIAVLPFLINVVLQRLVALEAQPSSHDAVATEFLHQVQVVPERVIHEHIVERRVMLHLFVEDCPGSWQADGDDLTEAPSHLLAELISGVEGEVRPGGMFLCGELPNAEGSVPGPLGGRDVEAVVAVEGIARDLARTAADQRRSPRGIIIERPVRGQDRAVVQRGQGPPPRRGSSTGRPVMAYSFVFIMALMPARLASSTTSLGSSPGEHALGR